MGYYVSKLKSLPTGLDWYIFLIGNYGNHSLINDCFRDDFQVIADRIGENAGIINRNERLETELQEALSRVGSGKLGQFMQDLEEHSPGMLISNVNPSSFYKTSVEGNDNVRIYYFPFKIIEEAYQDTNSLINDISDFSRGNNERFINKLSNFSRMRKKIFGKLSLSTGVGLGFFSFGIGNK